MSTPIGILWTLLSIMVAGTCSFSFLQPFWFIEPETFDSFGMYSYCIAVSRGKSGGGSRSYSQSRAGDVDKGKSHVCGIYGGTFHFSNLPSNSWQVREIICSSITINLTFLVIRFITMGRSTFCFLLRLVHTYRQRARHRNLAR